MSLLDLKEILWEITPECNKNCDFCGSKDIQKEKCLSNGRLNLIVEAICSYKRKINKPLKVTLTGGEPGLLDSALLTSIFNDFEKVGIQIAVVTNGYFFENFGTDNRVYVGVSINDAKDVTKFIKQTSAECTMITNFGTHNIWNFNELYKISEYFNCWQIQLTMGELMLPSDGIEFLWNKIREVEDSRIVLADNAREEHSCSAGINCCSITYDGFVVPCLSKRSWGDIVTTDGVNLFNYSLEHIWKMEFFAERFGDCKSCRDCVKYPNIKKFEEGLVKPIVIFEKEVEPVVTFPPVVSPQEKPPYDIGGVYMYAVFQPPVSNQKLKYYTDKDKVNWST